MRQFAKIAALSLTFIAACFASKEEGDYDGAHARALVEAGAPLIDVRSEGEFEDEHIEGAINIPLQEIGDRVDEVGTLVEGDKMRPIVVHCRSGKRSGWAAMFLRVAGYTDVRSVPGGMLDWQKQGFTAKDGEEP